MTDSRGLQRGDYPLWGCIGIMAVACLANFVWSCLAFFGWVNGGEEVGLEDVLMPALASAILTYIALLTAFYFWARLPVQAQDRSPPDQLVDLDLDP